MVESRSFLPGVLGRTGSFIVVLGVGTVMRHEESGDLRMAPFRLPFQLESTHCCGDAVKKLWGEGGGGEKRSRENTRRVQTAWPDSDEAYPQSAG